ncbi:MAG: DNA-binding protein [Bacteroidetes bacterium]|nr:MAG: DNA-binding protein [Bacteroidota bacterium]RLD49335.1 MAG: DNA-binding protein [Bacteroidota bacterium]RLD88529.1 MAG: DNA-binding protein [Bacteroidota bacterium]
MEEKEKQERREDIFSQAIRAGKRTYFFDVKATRTDQYYLTITESKRRFDPEQGKFYYEKHKIFLYQEDFEKFSNGFETAIRFIQTGERPAEDEPAKKEEETKAEEPVSTDVTFEDLGKEEEKEPEKD